jgi:hypothetical protein
LEITRRAFFIALCCSIVGAGLVDCRVKTAPLKNLAGYFRAERGLSSRIPEGPMRSDSLRIIRHAFGIDPDRSIAGLRGNPEKWETLLKELKNGK